MEQSSHENESLNLNISFRVTSTLQYYGLFFQLYALLMMKNIQRHYYNPVVAHVLVFCFFLSLVTAIYPIILSAHQLSTKGAHLSIYLSIRQCLTFSCVITFLAIFPSHLWLEWKSFQILPRKACCDMMQSLILVSTNATDQDLDLFTTSMCLCGLCIQLRATQCNNYSTSAAPSFSTLECL